MTPELHAHLVRLAEWVDDHLAAIEAEYPKDNEGFSILPKGPDGDAVRALQHVSICLTRTVFNM